MSTLARRKVLTALATAPLAGVSLAAVLADPRRARAAAMGLEPVTLTTEGGKTVKASLGLPAKAPAAAIVLIHEWWGLNDQIKAVAAEFAKEGYIALAVDLYDGRIGGTPEEARAIMQSVNPVEATDTLASWIGWLRGHGKSSGKIGTVGWCFGGGWSLSASIARPVDATVVYYGRVNHPVDELTALQGPVLGHFATRDRWINTEMVGGFEDAMGTAGKSAEVHWYEADHGFANPTTSRYDADDAQLAWRRTLAFFGAHLTGDA